MDPFELFLHLKAQIEGNEAIMRNLREYSFNPRHKLKCLGKGKHNTHFSMGKIRDLYLTTREYIGSGGSEVTRCCCENYLDRLVSLSVAGEDVPVICGGILVVSGDSERYFLLVEDLKKGGLVKNFRPAKPGDEFGMIGRRRVFYDFDEFSATSVDYKYMTEGKMIEVR